MWTDFLKYELQRDGVSHVYYPARNPQSLLITFACMGDRYNRVREFWNEEKWENVSYLFLCDVGSEGKPAQWYVDRDALIDFYAAQFTPGRIVTLGSSMGAFGALWHGFRLSAGAILAIAPAAPPLSFQGQDFDETLWRRLQAKMLECRKLPALYIETTGHPPDHQMTRTVVSHYLNTGGRLIAESDPSDATHCGTSMGLPRHAENTMRYFLGWPVAGESSGDGA